MSAEVVAIPQSHLSWGLTSRSGVLVLEEVQLEDHKAYGFDLW